MKIKLTDATDDQINAAIARLDEWIFLNGWWASPDDNHPSFLRCPPNYLHSWALCGPLRLRKIRIDIDRDGVITIWKTMPQGAQVLVFNDDYSELRARCLAFLHMHFPDGMIEVDDETS